MVCLCHVVDRCNMTSWWCNIRQRAGGQAIVSAHGDEVLSGNKYNVCGEE